MSKEFIRKELEESQRVLEQFISQEANIQAIEDAGQLMLECILHGGKIISCGNGGSMSDAMHFAEELTGRYRDNRKSLPAIAISDAGFLTCAGNDFGYDEVFSRFVEGMGNKGDVLLGISTSGNSKNVIRAIETAKSKGLNTVVLTGKDGGKLKGMADVEIVVDHHGYADRIQEIHIKVIHCLIGYIEHGLGV
jgi:D-sedoheptulose 7-phosphate isomerase